MTPILYRGKPTEDEDWVYGYYVENLISAESLPTFSPTRAYIVSTPGSACLRAGIDNERTMICEVLPDTVGMHPYELKDMDGTPIFTGDVLWCTPFNAHIVILYQASFSKFACKVIRTGEVMRFNPELAKQCTVSGNIIDDPDWRAL